jgi:hypothetical protein
MELAIILHKTPEEIRRMPLRDRNHIHLIWRANEQARLELAKRNKVPLSAVPSLM